MRQRRPQRAGQYRSPEYRGLLARLAHNVREARAARGWTQEEAAHRAGMSTPLYQRVEAAATNVTFTTLARLCIGLEQDAARLLHPTQGTLAVRARGRPKR
jgi:transcriptional regulator with XRE-family HTH domain